MELAVKLMAVPLVNKCYWEILLINSVVSLAAPPAWYRVVVVGWRLK